MFTIYKSALSWCNALFDRQPSVTETFYSYLWAPQPPSVQARRPWSFPMDTELYLQG